MLLRSLPSTTRALQPSVAPLRTSRRTLVTTAAQGDRPRTALITGGNTGIGYITARELAAKGFHVVLACRNEDKARAAQAKIRCMHAYHNAKLSN